jgi:hypothetical protein
LARANAFDQRVGLVQADRAAMVRATPRWECMFELSDKWAPYLTSQPETGMGFQIVSIHLSDGRMFEDVVIDGGYITRIGHSLDIPFVKADIEKITVTHGSKLPRGFWSQPPSKD